MAKKDKVRLPSSQGGIVSYGDSEDSYIQIKPTTIMGYVVAITILAIVVRLI
jgi:preprotein translocase subunit Sec61beta